MKLDQVVFGYDGGHRLLGGSRSLTNGSVSRLLSATDADPGDGLSRTVAGVPLPDDGAYAVAVTWSAPEIPRTGAVWSHVLVVSLKDLGRIQDPFALADLARRPSADGLSTYMVTLSTQLPVDIESKLGTPVPAELLTRVLAAEYLPGAPRRIEVTDPGLAERSIGLVWQSQWPPLRGQLSFYTRETAGSSEPEHGIILARRLRGAQPSPSAAVPRWLTVLASELQRGQQHGPLTSFLKDFGPDDRPSKSTVVFLGDLFDARETGDVGRVCSLIEARYDKPNAGLRLKRELFGQTTKSWSISERYRLNAVVTSEVDAWDFEALAIESRLSTEIRSTGVSRTLVSIRSPGTNKARAAMASALAKEGEPRDLGSIVKWDIRTATFLLEHEQRWLEHRQAWQSMQADQIRTVVTDLEITGKMVQAAVRGGCADVVAELVGTDSVLESIARIPDVELAEFLLADSTWIDAALSSESDRVILLAGAALDERPTDRLLEVLERRRTKPDKLWLRSAARAIGTRKRTKNVLKTTFGPLHRTITDDALPAACWPDLDKALPQAPDPALRLRRHLVREARSNRWTQEDIAAALRDAGPYTDEILRDLGDDDDWLTSAVRGVLRTLGLQR